MTINEIEAQILKEPALRLEKTLKKRKETLREFIEKFFINFNNNRDTIYVESKKTQTPTGKRRSLGDIFLICKYYYPNCTLQEVKDLLYFNCRTKKGFRSSMCSIIKKRVFYYDSESPNAIYNQNNLDEYSKNILFWDPTSLAPSQADDEEDEDFDDEYHNDDE